MPTATPTAVPDSVLPPPAVSPSAPVPRSACANCGAERRGDFCQACGQQYLPAGRLTLGHLWREFTERFLKLERGLFFTAWQLCLRPGAVARRYVRGERRRFINPLTYFLVACTIALIGYELVEDRMVEMIVGGMREQGNAESMTETMGKLFPGDDPLAGYGAFIFDIIQRTYSYLQFLLALPMAFFLRLFFRDRAKGVDVNMAETLVLALYVVAHFTLFGTFMQPVLLTLGMEAYVPFVLFIFGTGTAFCTWGALQFFERRDVGAALLGFLSFVLAYVVYFGVILVVILASIVWVAVQAARAGAL